MKIFLIWYINEKKTRELNNQTEKNKRLINLLLPKEIIPRIEQENEKMVLKNLTGSFDENLSIHSTELSMNSTQSNLPNFANDFFHNLCEDISVGFIKINDFKKIENVCSSRELIFILDKCFVMFDDILRTYDNLSKIKTTQEYYIFVSGKLTKDLDSASLPKKIKNKNNKEKSTGKLESDEIKNLRDAVSFSLKIIDSIDQNALFRERLTSPISVSIGISQGEVITAVLSMTKKPAYDIFGNVVNLASRSADYCEKKNSIHIEESVFNKLDKYDYLLAETSGKVKDVKGKGKMNFFTLLGKRGIDIKDIESSSEGSDEEKTGSSVHSSIQKSIVSNNSTIITGGKKNSLNVNSLIDLFVEKSENEEEEIEEKLYFKKNVSLEESNLELQQITEFIDDSFLYDKNITVNSTKNVSKFFNTFLGVFKNKKINEQFFKKNLKKNVKTNRRSFIIMLITFSVNFMNHVFSYQQGLVLPYITSHFYLMFLYYTVGIPILVISCVLIFTPLYSKNLFFFKILTILGSLGFIIATSIVDSLIRTTTNFGLNINFQMTQMFFCLLTGMNSLEILVAQCVLTLAYFLVITIREALFDNMSNLVILAFLSFLCYWTYSMSHTRECVSFFLRVLNYKKSQIFQIQKEKTKHLIETILPPEIITKLSNSKKEDDVIADYYENISVCYIDICNFTNFCSKNSPNRIVFLLYEVFNSFDNLIKEYKSIQKTQSIGDCYTCVSGTISNKFSQKEMALFALACIDKIKEFHNFKIRVGIHSGFVAGGITGNLRFRYNFFGQTIHYTKLMESLSMPNKILVSSEFRWSFGHNSSEKNGLYHFIKREEKVKADGHLVETFWLNKKANENHLE